MVEYMTALTRENMEAIGMNEEQIQRVLSATIDDQEKGEIVQMPQQPKKQEQVPDGFGTTIPVNCSEAMQVTTIFDLQTYSKGTLVRFPDFAEGQPFVARVRRPSMLVLAKQGKIPNSLLNSANELFNKGGGGMDADNENMLSDIYNICEIICESALKEPTYQQIKDAGLELSDDQLMAIFNYTQTGIKALESFR